MKKDIRLENEVEKTIKKFNREKKLPSAFYKSSSKPKLDKGDILMIILCVLLALFILSRIVIINVNKFIPSKILGVDYFKYNYPIVELDEYNRDRCTLGKETKLDKNVDSG